MFLPYLLICRDCLLFSRQFYNIIFYKKNFGATSQFLGDKAGFFGEVEKMFYFKVEFIQITNANKYCFC
ncbi:MAG: hypothetical protein B6D61_04410 [Bacteroidetes bacterium 4484_249]|nr:MAG: hypothetical protein B6D61_04410 [Bacteroidetes bacterium 4484_249]